MTETSRPRLPAPPIRPAGAPTALQGLRVVDFSHFIAGPVCTLLLADLGAEVIKIENAAKGDDLRRFRPQIDGQSAAFLWANRNKLGITLDLTRVDARKIARELVATADILVENFSTGVMDRFGLGYGAMIEANPRLVYCSVSAYGRHGPLADRLGFDPVVQAESGFMSLNGYPDRPGVRTGPSVMDVSSGMMAAISVLGAITARERTGRGQHVEVALFDTATMMLGFHAINHLASGVDPTRQANGSIDSAPTGVFEASDGPIYIACANDRTFQRLATEVLGRPDLTDDPRFRTSADRVGNIPALSAVINGILAGAGRRHWTGLMRKAGVPAGPVRSLSEAMQSDEMRERALLSEIAHPEAGSVPSIATPLRFSDTPVVAPVAAPTLGQHTHDVLARVLGYDDPTLAALSASGAFGKPE